MTTRERLQVSVKWGKNRNRNISLTKGCAMVKWESIYFVDACCFYRFDVSWFKETTMRGLLSHVLSEINSNLCFDDIEEINVNAMQHVDECDSTRVRRKRPFLNITATRLLDDEVYDVMMDYDLCADAQFDFIVKIREFVASKEGSELYNMGFLVPFNTVGNGLWEMDQWELGFGWLRWLRGFGMGNSWERKNFRGNGG